MRKASGVLNRYSKLLKPTQSLQNPHREVHIFKGDGKPRHGDVVVDEQIEKSGQKHDIDRDILFKGFHETAQPLYRLSSH